MKKIDIILASYNGEKYIEEQLNSIISQTYDNWQLIIRDDFSKDSTVKIIEKYCNNYPGKINLIKDNKGNLGFCKNFSELLFYCESDYIMLCDQDDFWKKDKIELTLNKMIESEAKYKNIPIMVHTDLHISDDKLNIIYDSFYKKQSSNPLKHRNLNRLICSNLYIGCTIMFNKSMLDIIKPLPNEVLIHDWWIALLASSIGKIEYLDKQTIFYRQHSNNTIGFLRKKSKNSVSERRKGFLKEFDLKIKNAEVLYYFLSSKKLIDNKTKLLLEDIINIKTKNFFLRKWILLKNKIYERNFLLTLRMYLYI